MRNDINNWGSLSIRIEGSADQVQLHSQRNVYLLRGFWPLWHLDNVRWTCHATAIPIEDYTGSARTHIQPHSCPNGKTSADTAIVKYIVAITVFAGVATDMVTGKG